MGAASPGSAPSGGGEELGRRLSTAMVLFHESLGRRLGLSAADQRALGLIVRHQPLSASDIADLTGLARASVTGLLDRLESAGHVRREADPADRRKLLVLARPREDPAVVGAFQALAADMRAVMAHYSQAEQETIQDYVNRTIEVLERQTRRLAGPTQR